MLGKIIKYDMKAMNRFLIIIHAFLLIYAFFIRILITGRLTANNVHNLGNTYFLILGLTVSFGIILQGPFCHYGIDSNSRDCSYRRAADRRIDPFAAQAVIVKAAAVV